MLLKIWKLSFLSALLQFPRYDLTHWIQVMSIEIFHEMVSPHFSSNAYSHLTDIVIHFLQHLSFTLKKNMLKKLENHTPILITKVTKTIRLMSIRCQSRADVFHLCLTLLVLKPECLGITGSIPWLLVPWQIVSPRSLLLTWINFNLGIDN